MGSLINASDEAILQHGLIQNSEGFLRLKKEGGHYIREDDRILKRNAGQSLRDGGVFCFMEVSHKKILIKLNWRKGNTLAL